MKLLQVENISFSYNKENIFENIKFDLHKGEVICLIGANGCGKTTLLDCILGINPIKSGEIIINGRNISSLKAYEIAKQISYVPQSNHMTFQYTVLDIVLMGRAAYKPIFSNPDSKDIVIAENALEMVGMEEFKNRIYTELSGGEAQMVMIARALAQNSPIIIMDEPTAHLDFNHELWILETIVDLVKNKKISIIMATHFPNHAFYFENQGVNTYVAIMDNKIIDKIGPPSEILTKENICKIFNIDVKIVTCKDKKFENLNTIIPLNTRRDRTI